MIEAPLPLTNALRLVLADAPAAMLATVACVSRDLWQTAKSVATTRLAAHLDGAAALPRESLPGADILFVLATVERGRSSRSRGLTTSAAVMGLARQSLSGKQELAFNSAGCVLHLSVGADHVLCTTSAGRLFSCGSGRHGRLGYRPDHPRLWQQQFREVEFPTVDSRRRVFIVKAEAGGRHSVALSSQGRAYTWGFGRRGRLGHGDGRTYYTPHGVAFDKKSDKGEAGHVKAGGTKTFDLVLVDVSAGGAHTLFVAASGDAYSCGIGGDGRLGLGHNRRTFRPSHLLSLALAGVRVVACAAGGGRNDGHDQREFGAHSVFLATDGSCWSCGCVGNGRLGMRTRIFSRKGYGAFSRTCYSWSSPHSSINQMIPAQMAAWDCQAGAKVESCTTPPRVKQVVAGERSTLLLCEDNSLISFGMSLRGAKRACSLATDKFLKTFEGVDRVEGMDGDLHGVPPACLVPYGGQPEDPFIERPTLPAAASTGRHQDTRANKSNDRLAAEEGGEQVTNVVVFAARGCLFVCGRQRGGNSLLWRKQEDAGTPEWELMDQ